MRLDTRFFHKHPLFSGPASACLAKSCFWGVLSKFQVDSYIKLKIDDFDVYNIFEEKNAFSLFFSRFFVSKFIKNQKFIKIVFDTFKSEAGACLAKCFHLLNFEAGCAYELGAYKKNTCTCKLAHLHTGTLAHWHTCTLANLHTCTLLHSHTCILGLLHTCTFAHLHTWTFAHLHICTLAHLHNCTFAYLHIDILAHLHICTRAHWPTCTLAYLHN